MILKFQILIILQVFLDVLFIILKNNKKKLKTFQYYLAKSVVD